MNRTKTNLKNYWEVEMRKIAEKVTKNQKQ